MQRRDDHPRLVPLFDAVAAAPDDDDPRQVLADALLERGDLRGEFIALQLLRARQTATPEQRAREAALEKEHWRAWLCEVPGVGVTTTRVTPLHDFHRGFLRSCVLSPCDLGADSPSWRMVERIDLTGDHPGQELAAPALTRLRVLTGLDADSLKVVLAGPAKPRLHELSVSHQTDDREQAQVLALARFPSLRVLTLIPQTARHRADWLSWLFEAPLLRQLDRLTLQLELPFDVGGMQAQLTRHRLDRLTLELRTMGVKLVLRAGALAIHFDDASWLTRHTPALRNLAAQFSPFPFARFEVRVGGAAATRAQLQRLGDLFLAGAR